TRVGGEDSADLDALFDDCTAVADAQVDFRDVVGINMMFNDDLDGYAWGGARCSRLDGVQRCWSTTWNPPWSFNNVAPLAHEMGHGYGLPHSDNSDGDSDPYDNPWDVMSSAWYNAVQDATYGARPKHINIYQRDRLGWVAPARRQVVQVGAEPVRVHVDYASLAVSSNVQMLVLQGPSTPDPYLGTIYTVEARRPVGAYEGALAGDAVIIHAVGSEYRAMAKSQDADVPPADISNNEGSMGNVGETWRAADGRFFVRGEARTATGLTVLVGAPLMTGGHPGAATGAVSRGARVLDLAGGAGDIAALLRPRVGDAGEIVLGDINGEMLRVGRDRLVDRGHVRGFQYVQCNAQALPFPDGSFDLVTI